MLPLVSHLASNDNHNLKVILLVRECEDFSTDRLMELENDEQGVLKTPSLRVARPRGFLKPARSTRDGLLAMTLSSHEENYSLAQSAGGV